MINKFQTGGQASAQQQKIIMDAAEVLQRAGYNVVDQQGNLDQQAFIQAVADFGAQNGIQVNQQNIGQVISQIAGMKQSARKGAKLNYLKKITNTCPEGTQLTYYKVGGQICSKCEAVARQQKAVNVMDSIKAEMFQPGGKVNTTEQKTARNKNTKTIQKPPIKKVTIHKYDTVHVNGKPYTLTNSDGSSVNPNLKFPLYSPAQYRKDKASKNPDARRRAQKADEMTSEKKGGTITAKACPKCGKVHAGKCGSKLMKKKKKCACGNKLDAKKCGGKAVSKKPMDKCGAKMKKAKKHELGGILEAMQKFAKGGSLKGIPFKS